MNYLPTGMAVLNFIRKQDPHSTPWAHWQYANAIDEGKDHYSTDDKTLLHFSKELEERFGVPIITHQQAVHSLNSRIQPWIPGPNEYEGPFHWGIKTGVA